MTYEQAIEMLKLEYERALGLKYVNNPLAYALYVVWGVADKNGFKRAEERRSKGEGK